MVGMTSPRNFQVDLRGIINLLSDHLYSGPQVYIRELLQNAVDAITARQHVEPEHHGSIRFEVFPASAKNPATLVVTDNGVGLTEDEVHQFLATIGQSSKRDPLRRADFIGQFGIGLLSAFVVCEEIVVITRSVRDGARTVEWKGRSDGTYAVRLLERDFEPGTQVFLRGKPGAAEYFEADFVRRTARHYGCHLPVPIQIQSGDDRALINEDPPWRGEYTSSEIARDRWLEYGRRVFETEFLDAIPLESQEGGVEGVAFVLPFEASLARRSTHRVYLKNMLLAEQVENLLPDWAFFVRCVVNATGLRPTANREAFYEDETLAATRDALGQCLRRYLLRLAQEDRRRLDAIIALHHLPMKALAAEDDEFYQLFVQWLPFETSLGRMTLTEFWQHESTVRYTRTVDEFRQIVSVATAQSIGIVNGGYTYDTELLEKLPQVFPDAQVERVDVSDLAESFEDLSLDERDEMFELLRVAELVLQPFRCAVDVKKFRPAELPALYTTNDASLFLRSIEQSRETADELWSGVLDSMQQIPAADAFARLCLNYNSDLIRRLAGVENRGLLRRAMEMLYVQALLLGHYPLKAQEMELLTSGLLGLIEHSLGNGGTQP